MPNRSLTRDAGDFLYLTGETHYSFPLGEGTLRFNLHADDECKVYLVGDGEKDQFMPLRNGSEVSFEYRLRSFTQLLIKTKKATRLAIQCDFKSRSDLDPLDYTPVKIDPPHAQTERHMLEILLDEKLRAMGIEDPHDAPVEDDLDDFDFFEEDSDLPSSPFQDVDEIMGMTPQQPENDNAGDEPQSEDADVNVEPDKESEPAK